MTATCDAPHRGIRGGDQRKVSAGNADGFIVRFSCVACNEWTASRQVAPMRQAVKSSPPARMNSNQPASVCSTRPR